VFESESDLKKDVLNLAFPPLEPWDQNGRFSRVLTTTSQLKGEYSRNETSHRRTEKESPTLLHNLVNFSPQTAENLSFLPTHSLRFSHFLLASVFIRRSQKGTQVNFATCLEASQIWKCTC